MSNRSEIRRAVLIAHTSRSGATDGALDAVRTYRYDLFSEALTREGLETSIVRVWPEEITAAHVLFHTIGIDHRPLQGFGNRYGADARARAIPVMTSLPGALHSVIEGGASAAIEREGYSRWARGEEAGGQPSGLVIPASRAAASGLPVLEAYADAALIEAIAPLPRLLVRALGVARAR